MFPFKPKTPSTPEPPRPAVPSDAIPPVPPWVFISEKRGANPPPSQDSPSGR